MQHSILLMQLLMCGIRIHSYLHLKVGFCFFLVYFAYLFAVEEEISRFLEVLTLTTAVYSLHCAT